ncbi:hypothetical protein PHLGIDRAFT_374625 [Phlebiopsis gigantea 11061_1 CR5-6]|uniref:Stc1 domain-containing protein n=1 Tax=Phlebiopsis gigantea (strain 11061_1 CR5-6) TaxID=745531 RepID=A0A0C3N9T5_PHLG1|nr:hypothetical protein PHLGIDRAFT_374625 [Phlebiopsis gigantea 11061_1 CR5-6]
MISPDCQLILIAICFSTLLSPSRTSRPHSRPSPSSSFILDTELARGFHTRPMQAQSQSDWSGTSHKLCSTPGCGYIVETIRSTHCLVCRHKQNDAAERARLRALLKPRCTVCHRRVKLKSPARPTQVVMCLDCVGSQRSYERRRALGHGLKLQPDPRVYSSLPTTPTIPSGVPSTTTLRTHPQHLRLLHGDGGPRTLASTESPRLHGDELPHGQKREHASPHAYTPPAVSPTSPASYAQTSAAGTPSIASVDVYEEEMPQGLRELLERSERAQRIILELERIAHFNERGEYILPWLPVRRKTVST